MAWRGRLRGSRTHRSPRLRGGRVWICKMYTPSDLRARRADAAFVFYGVPDRGRERRTYSAPATAISAKANHWIA